MTDLEPQGILGNGHKRIRLSGGVFWMFVLAPFLIAIGAFISVAMLPSLTVGRPSGDAVLMAWVGALVLCLGVVFLASGIVLAGVKTMLQQQVELDVPLDNKHGGNVSHG